MKPVQRIGAALGAGACLFLVSCTTGGVSPSGFLGNYSQLDAGYGTEDAVSSYVKPGVDLKRYDSVIIDPVTTVVAAPGISPDVRDQLAFYLDGALRSQMPSSLKLASTPGPSTLRVRTALTDVIEGGRNTPASTTVHTKPRARLSGRLGSDAVAGFISDLAFEGEILDSSTGERISALCDHRHGAKREATAATTWEFLAGNASQGADRLWRRFTAARGD
jgi:hypothetical protein